MPISLFQKPESHLGSHRYLRDERPDRDENRRRGEVPHVLMIGLGPNIRGGMTSVIEAYLQSRLWLKYSFSWLSTYDDRGPVERLGRLLAQRSQAAERPSDEGRETDT